MMIFIIEMKEEKKGGERQRLDVEEINRAIYIFFLEKSKKKKEKIGKLREIWKTQDILL